MADGCMCLCVYGPRASNQGATRRYRSCIIWQHWCHQKSPISSTSLTISAAANRSICFSIMFWLMLRFCQDLVVAFTHHMKGFSFASPTIFAGAATSSLTRARTHMDARAHTHSLLSLSLSLARTISTAANRSSNLCHRTCAHTHTRTHKNTHNLSPSLACMHANT